MNMIFFKNYFPFPVFIFVFFACFSGTAAHGQDDTEAYTNSSYLLEIPPVPEFNPHILNCFKKEGYYVLIKEFLCPVNKTESFLSPELTVHTTYGRNLDWAPSSHIGFPPPMPVCPTNGAVITKPNYNNEEIELLTMAVNTDAYKSLYAEKHASYFLRAELDRILELDKENRWWHLLHATWEAEHCGAKDKYRHYALKTIEAAKERLKALSGKENEYRVLNIIIPNLYRRIGDFSAAQKWLDNVKDKTPQGDEQTENFAAAFRLLQKAINEKNTAQVPLRPEEDGKSP